MFSKAESVYSAVVFLPWAYLLIQKLTTSVSLSPLFFSSPSLIVTTLPAAIPGTTEAKRRQWKSARLWGGLCCTHLHGPAGSDFSGCGTRRPCKPGRKCNCGGPLSRNHVPTRLHLHRPLYQICGMILIIIWKYFNGIVLIHKDSLYP